MAATFSLAFGMFVSGSANSLLTKYQDMQCAENCEPDAVRPRVNYEQPVWQTLNMFVGEFGCIVAVLWQYYRTRPVKEPYVEQQASVFTRILGRLPLGTGPGSAPTGYTPVAGTDRHGSGEDDGTEQDDDSVVLHLAGEQLTGWRICWMWIPAILDILGTTLLNVGLIYTPVSVYQMSRGSLVLWVGICSATFLRRHIHLYQWFALMTVMIGVALVGLAGIFIKKAASQLDPALTMLDHLADIAAREDDDPARVALGVMTILSAQIFTAAQFVTEEKIMGRYKVAPAAAVCLEGFFGFITTLGAMPVLHYFLRHRSPYFDMTRGWHQIIENPPIWGTSIAIMFSIGVFNLFGLSMTNRVSATARSTIDTLRTLGIWVVSLLLRWETLVFPFSLLQVAGFALVVYGTFLFNGIFKPLFCVPEPALTLPHERQLSDTAQAPAAAAEGRTGYDVLPESERRAG